MTVFETFFILHDVPYLIIVNSQVPPTIPEADPLPKIPSDPALWEGCETVNENERNRNQLMTLQYHQSLMRIQSVKRSNSVKMICRISSFGINH